MEAYAKEAKMADPYSREEFERFAKFAKGGSGYVERRLVATVQNLYETIDGLYAALEGKGGTNVDR